MVNEIKTEIKLKMDAKPENIFRLMLLSEIDHWNHKTLTQKQRKAINTHIKEWFSKVLKPIKTFDDVVFGDSGPIILGWGSSAYIQVIERNNPSAWCWEPIDFDSYTILERLKEDPIKTLWEELRELTRKYEWALIPYWYYTLKHEIEQKYWWIDEDKLLKQLTIRIEDDVLATANQYYEEGFENDYLSEHFDRSKNDFESVIEEAREAYEGTEEQKEDLKLAFCDTSREYLEYSKDEITKKAVETARKKLSEVYGVQIPKEGC